jgi:hypothetical protein
MKRAESHGFGVAVAVGVRVLVGPVVGVVVIVGVGEFDGTAKVTASVSATEVSCAARVCSEAVPSASTTPSLESPEGKLQADASTMSSHNIDLNFLARVNIAPIPFSGHIHRSDVNPTRFVPTHVELLCSVLKLRHRRFSNV